MKKINGTKKGYQKYHLNSKAYILDQLVLIEPKRGLIIVIVIAKNVNFLKEETKSIKKSLVEKNEKYLLLEQLYKPLKCYCVRF